MESFVLFYNIGDYSGSVLLGVYSSKEKLDSAIEQYECGYWNLHPDDKNASESRKAQWRKKLWFEERTVDDPAKQKY